MRTFLLILLSISFFSAKAQQDTTEDKKLVEKLKYKQQPGLAMAASKIFFSDKPWSISGFGEANYVSFTDNKNTDVGDIELYYTNLFRFATFFGYRFSDKIVLNTELQVEHLRYRNEEDHTEFLIEAFMDFLLYDAFKFRIGFYPLPIGYVNNNDEPIQFYSVNRPEVERIIIPSTWIELGVMFYGNLGSDWSYALGVSQGLEGEYFLGPSWIRQGRTIRAETPRGMAVNPQINYTGIKNLTLSTSGYFGTSGQGLSAQMPNGNMEHVTGFVNLYTGYAKYKWNNLRIVACGAYGNLHQTHQLYHLTGQLEDANQLLGKNTFGYYLETGFDLLPYFRNNVADKGNWLYNKSEMKLPVFVRYERLDTHSDINAQLRNLGTVFPRSNLDIVTFGVNFKPKENIVLKANYQLRHGRLANQSEPDQIELGIGFIF